MQAYLNEATYTVHLSADCAGTVHDSGRLVDMDGTACGRCGAKEARREQMSDELKEWADKAEEQWEENRD